ncbi:MAG: TlpA disulfide reductase family protein [Phenylobacterium sp.]|nr:TlpA disulfide reductase family protein [Phenylobacterium sp.]
MSEGPEASGGSGDGSVGGQASKPKAGFLTRILWGVALLGVAAVVYIIAQASSNQTGAAPPTSGASSANAEAGFADKFKRPKQPGPSPDYVFYDDAGKPMTLADLKGKVVVMNIWATWCAPCKVEMPTLATLQGAYRNQPVEVVAVSIDTIEDAAKARLFIAQNDPLKFYHDREKKMPFKLVPMAPGAPTTVVYGKDGLEIGRVEGEADWSSPEARAVIDAALKAG